MKYYITEIQYFHWKISQVSRPEGKALEQFCEVLSHVLSHLIWCHKT